MKRFLLGLPLVVDARCSGHNPDVAVDPRPPLYAWSVLRRKLRRKMPDGPEWADRDQPRRCSAAGSPHPLQILTNAALTTRYGMDDLDQFALIEGSNRDHATIAIAVRGYRFVVTSSRSERPPAPPDSLQFDCELAELNDRFDPPSQRFRGLGFLVGTPERRLPAAPAAVRLHAISRSSLKSLSMDRCAYPGSAPWRRIGWYRPGHLRWSSAIRTLGRDRLSRFLEPRKGSAESKPVSGSHHRRRHLPACCS